MDNNLPECILKLYYTNSAATGTFKLAIEKLMAVECSHCGGIGHRSSELKYYCPLKSKWA